MHEFLDFIADNGLLDLPVEVLSHGLTLDWMFRFLLSTDWEKNFLNVYQCPLTRLLFDHFPIMLEGRNF